MSPLQFQKLIRLHETRRMLLSRNVDATHVSLDVGYESTSQFNREYRRLFGKPPGRDAAEARRAVEDNPSTVAVAPAPDERGPP